MIALTLLLHLAGPGDAPPAHLVHARLQTHSAASGLASTFNGLLRQAGPAWIAYRCGPCALPVWS